MRKQPFIELTEHAREHVSVCICREIHPKLMIIAPVCVVSHDHRRLDIFVVSSMRERKGRISPASGTHSPVAELRRYPFIHTVKYMTEITTASLLDVGDCGRALVVIHVIRPSRSGLLKVMRRARRYDRQAGTGDM
jgi:hypothetical protein